MKGHCKPDFDAKVTEFAMYLRQKSHNDVNMDAGQTLTKTEEDLLRKFGKFLEMDRHGKYGKFAKHGHHGKFSHGHFPGHGKHWHRGHHGHHGKHGHFQDKFMGHPELQKMFAELSEMQQRLASSFADNLPERHSGCHRQWTIGHRRGRCNTAPVAQNESAVQTEAPKEVETTKEAEATQNLASMVETIDIGNSPTPSEH